MLQVAKKFQLPIQTLWFGCRSKSVTRLPPRCAINLVGRYGWLAAQNNGLIKYLLWNHVAINFQQ